MDLGGGQPEVGSDVPAREVGGLPVKADAAKWESGAVHREPGDVEWSIGKGGDALDQRAAYSCRHGPMGKAMQRRDFG
ncbi:hypothetical protein SNOUR_07695 [Streptomyces noursei ATCC 11455]|nr:hypothetical protein SNOUR_07695 [Streptomyces noursei ATCC 11455]